MRCAFQAVTVKGYIDRVEVVAGHQVVARHRRSYGRDEQILDPLHYLATLGRRPAALDHAPVLRDWRLPASFTQLRAGAGAAARRDGWSAAVHPRAAIAGGASRWSGCSRPWKPAPRLEEAQAERIAADGSAVGRAGHGCADVSGTPLTVNVQVPAARPGPVRPTTQGQGERTMADDKHALLRANLKQLRLPTMAAEFEKLAREAAAANEGYEQYLLRLTELEVAARSSNAVQTRIRAGRLPGGQGLRHLRLQCRAHLSKPKVLELARGEWIEQRTNVCLIGSPGTGKSHLIQAAGQQECVHG